MDMVERAYAVLARLDKRPVGKLEREAAQVIRELLADREEWIEVPRMVLGLTEPPQP